MDQGSIHGGQYHLPLISKTTQFRKLQLLAKNYIFVNTLTVRRAFYLLSSFSAPTTDDFFVARILMMLLILTVMQ